MCLSVNNILHVNLQYSFYTPLLGELNSEKSGRIHRMEGGRNKEDLSENGEHAVKRATEQSE